MIRYFFLIFTLIGVNVSFSQTDSTDLELYLTDPIIETGLDSIMYLERPFQNINLDFDVSDTMSFAKAHFEIIELDNDRIVFRKSYTLANLVSEELIDSWTVSIPFGNVLNTSAYLVAVKIEEYDGTLGSNITKTIIP